MEQIKSLQAWILVLDIEQCPAKNQIMSDESCFLTETIVWHKIFKKIMSYRRFKTKLVGIR